LAGCAEHAHIHIDEASFLGASKIEKIGAEIACLRMIEDK
jgi:hypothetical protein